MPCSPHVSPERAVREEANRAGPKTRAPREREEQRGASVCFFFLVVDAVVGEAIEVNETSRRDDPRHLILQLRLVIARQLCGCDLFSFEASVVGKRS